MTHIHSTYKISYKCIILAIMLLWLGLGLGLELMQELKWIHSICPLNYTWSRIDLALIFGGMMVCVLYQWMTVCSDLGL